MPCAMCGELSETDGPPIFLYWSGRTVEAMTLSGTSLFVCDTASHNCTSVRPFKDYIGVLWSIPRYRVHLSEWVEQDGGWKPTVLTIRGEWLKWRLFECDWLLNGACGLNIGWRPKCVTYWAPVQWRTKMPWYFVCEQCQVSVRRDLPGWDYDNINADGYTSDSSDTDWSDTDMSIAW